MFEIMLKFWHFRLPF